MLHAVWHVVVFSSNDPVLVYDRPHAPQMVVQEIAGIVFFTQSANASHGKGSALECGLCPLQFITDASDIQVSVTPDVSRGDLLAIPKNLLIIPLTYSINGIMSMKLKFLYREKSLYIVLIAGFFLS